MLKGRVLQFPVGYSTILCMESEVKKTYELSYFITPEVKDEEVVAYAQKIKDFVTGEKEEKTEITREEMPSKRRLAYPIEHKKQGYFGFMHFAASPEKLKEVKNKLVLDNNILRHLIIVVDKKQVAHMTRPAPRVAAVKQPVQAEIDKEVFKKGHTVSQQEENKVEFEELDKKLEEILNK
ncbi:30S ribosomal protein S6 [Candidatus Azambacteria bacterium RIFCSPHIGHO2_02_FULL_52_12]|uniref:Small ribosomal subunit protein bS6 n=1 Tax=Candidatus Azambacteria bacterium RIFCSPLOWO2_01_FULL_46_25 TaxID=1797298 RepID=A0A1F5BVG0_9BACT|nr:MAG: 30S ribosomal protein S6 [Candidatus Azambacteria bacterium RIFCSPHIGHO2_02_FULL_52_12]OGD34591.1 MAG: 30S ribosomal protein S6 [Candidatus Azambacteria bacterium RIFCSPLOWO2_01_FULL_46_25]